MAAGERNGAGPVWAVAALLACAALASVAAVRSGAGVEVDFVAGAVLGLSAEGPAVVLLPTVLAVATLAMVVSAVGGQAGGTRYAALMLLFTAAAAVTVTSTSLPTLLLGWELMGAASGLLIGLRVSDPRHVASGATAFLTTRAADLGLYAAAGAALAGGSDLGLDALAGLPDGWRNLAAAGVLVAALGKAAQLPFSFWLSRAMDGPSPVSALLHSAAMVALGGWLLLRLSPLLAATGWADHAAAWAGAATAVVLGAVAVVQTDLKQLLAASTAAQLGFVVLAAGLGATAAGTAHLVAHAAVKALLFLAAGAWLEALGTRRLAGLRGAARRWPAVGALAVAALLALAGIPPLSLWATKDAVLAAALHDSPALYVAGLVATALAAAYATVALVTLLAEDDGSRRLDPEEAGAATGRVPAGVPLALAPLALGAVGLGALALPGVLERLPGRASAEPTSLELVASAVLVLAAAGVAVLAADRLRRPHAEAPGLRAAADALRGWLGLERAVHAALVRPCLRLADAAARFDDRRIAGAVASVAAGARSAAAVSRRGDDALDGVVRGTAGTAARLGGGVRRTSRSGQLHHYYLQLVGGVLVVLVVLTAVLIATR